ncbi:MAG: hypothetical protein ACRDFC_05015 [Ignavibacteria bacterium]
MGSDTTLVLLYSQNELLLDVTNNPVGYYVKDTLWQYQDNTLKDLYVTFSGETDTSNLECGAFVDLYYIDDSTHYHFYTYSQFGRDSVNRFHQFTVNVQQYNSRLIYYLFGVFIYKSTNAPVLTYIKLRDIRLYKKVVNM